MLSVASFAVRAGVMLWSRGISPSHSESVGFVWRIATLAALAILFVVSVFFRIRLD